MVIAKVYHDRLPTFRDSDPFFLDGDNHLPNKYELVAEVTIEAREKPLTNEGVLEIAYEQTNTINDVWWKNPNVKKLVDRDCRSTSVGDIVRIDVCYYIVKMVGWGIIKPRWYERDGDPGLGWLHHGFCTKCKSPLTGKRYFIDVASRFPDDRGDGMAFDNFLRYCKDCKETVDPAGKME
jgi:hypothetical protein